MVQVHPESTLFYNGQASIAPILSRFLPMMSESTPSLAISAKQTSTDPCRHNGDYRSGHNSLGNGAFIQANSLTPLTYLTTFPRPLVLLPFIHSIFLMGQASKVALIPWDPDSPAHRQCLVQQREECSWHQEKVETTWKDEQIRGDKCIYWIVRVFSPELSGSESITFYLRRLSRCFRPMSHMRR